jgi:hypothetical protein
VTWEEKDADGEECTLRSEEDDAGAVQRVRASAEEAAVETLAIVGELDHGAGATTPENDSC